MDKNINLKRKGINFNKIVRIAILISISLLLFGFLLKNTIYKYYDDVYFNFSNECFYSDVYINGIYMNGKTKEETDLFLYKNSEKTNIKKAKNSMYTKSLKKKVGLIGEFGTKVSNNYSRNNNIKIALSFINGTVLKPGEVFSFNKVVGDTNLSSRGFMLAPALLNGVLIEAYGGGVCQVASTVYGAALRANMAIMERYNHSIKSKYVPVGQDATVSYNSIDLKFKNSLKRNIYISMYLNNNNLVCQFYGPYPLWYDNIKIVSGYIDGSSNKAFAQRVFYKKEKEVYRENLPFSLYK